MNRHQSARELIAETRKRFMAKYSFTSGDDLVIYLDLIFLELCGAKYGHDDIPHGEKCMGCSVRIGCYRDGDSELPPFMVMVEHRGRPDRFVIGGI